MPARGPTHSLCRFAAPQCPLPFVQGLIQLVYQVPHLIRIFLIHDQGAKISPSRIIHADLLSLVMPTANNVWLLWFRCRMSQRKCMQVRCQQREFLKDIVLREKRKPYAGESSTIRSNKFLPLALQVCRCSFY